MCLLDTTDGALRKASYTSTALAKDGIAILHYSIFLTVIMVFIAMVKGLIQMLSLILDVFQPIGIFSVSKSNHTTAFAQTRVCRMVLQFLVITTIRTSKTVLRT